MDLKEKRLKRGQLVQQMRTLTDKADSEKRSLTPEESKTWDDLEGEQEKIRAEIDADEKDTQRRARVAELEGQLNSASGGGIQTGSGSGGGDQTRSGVIAGEILESWPTELRAAVTRAYQNNAFGARTRSSTPFLELFRSFLEGGNQGMQAHLAGVSDTNLRNVLQADLFTKGGALRPPMQFIGELLKNVDDAVFVLKYARKFRLLEPSSLGVPTLDSDVEDDDWTSELATGQQGTMSFGTRELRPHPLAKRIKVSKTLKRVSAIPMDGMVRQRLEYKTGITKEKAYLLGDGAQKPLGVFVPSNDGVPTSRDVVTGSATDFTADGLMDGKYELKQAYWPGARWAFHRFGLKRVRKLKDAQGQYIWQPGLTGAAPDTILEQPYDVSEYVPNTFTTGQYVAILANWQAGYWVVDSLDMGIEVIDQLYAEQNQDGYILRYEGDGAPVLPEAFVRMKTS